ncbi:MULTISPECIES: hypothetical protein [Haloferax]|uniref:Recombinase RecA n=2 Tax=Haloferax TaxID=2251 RepID=A0A6G1YZB3_9EURY|nr:MULTISPECIES: hypothetical protein [Haloferax]KAB1186956.1 hypothetical protein Hfx1149_02485 [Haloferax sp. CBA1149]MRW79585.1 hypothetical protein [Haloferax marinisediminis]
MGSEGISLDDETARSVLILDSDISPLRFGLTGVSGLPLLALDFSPRSTGDRDRWERRLGFRPAELVVVTTETRDPDAVGADAIEQVTSPSDLTGLGMKATEHLARWDDGADAVTPVVVLNSLTILFQYAGMQAIYRFLHALTTRIANSDGHGVFFLDPLTQDDKTVHTLASLFDAVARRGDDGEWTVSAR